MKWIDNNGRQRCDCQCHPDWSWLRFGGTRINFSDIDGIFLSERFDRFLIVEWKKPGETLPDAQLRVAVALTNLSEERFRVLVVHAPLSAFTNGATATMQVQRVRPYRGRDLKEMRRIALPVSAIKDCDQPTFQRWVDDWWYRDAKNGGRP